MASLDTGERAGVDRGRVKVYGALVTHDGRNEMDDSKRVAPVIREAVDEMLGVERAIREGYPHPIAYTFEAAYHCPSCTAARFGVDAEGFIPETARDREGNPIGAVAPWDEWQNIGEGPQTLSCDTCGRELDTYGEALTDETLDHLARAGVQEARIQAMRHTRDQGGN